MLVPKPKKAFQSPGVQMAGRYASVVASCQSSSHTPCRQARHRRRTRVSLRSASRHVRGEGGHPVAGSWRLSRPGARRSAFTARTLEAETDAAEDRTSLRRDERTSRRSARCPVERLRQQQGVVDDVVVLDAAFDVPVAQPLRDEASSVYLGLQAGRERTPTLLSAHGASGEVPQTFGGAVVPVPVVGRTDRDPGRRRRASAARRRSS